MGNLGKTMIATGLLMFGFVAYQLWGTGIENAQAQNRLENEFEALLASVPSIDGDTFGDGQTTQSPGTVDDPIGQRPPDAEADTTTDADFQAPPQIAPADAPPAVVVPAEDQNLPAVEDGSAIAKIEIPAIGVSEIVVAGVQTRDLKKGPGHFPDTPLPGQLGNAAIAGHRTTYGEPFYDVDKLQPGDTIVTTTLNGVFTYAVTGTRIVEPSDYQVVATTDPNRATLTLTSCHPKWTARQRIVIFSELISEASAPIGEPVLNYGRPEPSAPVNEIPGDANLPADDALVTNDPNDATTNIDSADVIDEPVVAAPGAGSGTVTGNVNEEPVVTDTATPAVAQGEAATLGSAAVNAGIADAFSEGWFSDPAANLQVGLWGLILAAIALGAYLVSRRLRRDWAGGLIALLPFVVTLYFFFQNVNRLLPPNL